MGLSQEIHSDDGDIDIEELERIILSNEDEDEDENVTRHNDSDSFTEASRLQELLETAHADDKKELTKTNSISKLQEQNSKTIIKEIFGDINDNEIDSSDDEEVKNFLERKYNEYGKDINAKLKQKSEEEKERKIIKEVTENLSNESSKFLSNFSYKEKKINHQETFLQKKLELNSNSNVTKTAVKNTNLNSSVHTDPIFGMRIVNPLISSSLLTDRMVDKKAVGTCSIPFHIQRGDLSKDWVTAGAIVNKSPVKTAKNGSSFSIWRISDLKGDVKMVSVYLFRSAHKELWKTVVGTVVAILNPGVFDRKDNKFDIACLSVDTATKVMIIGQSKDLGTCKAIKKNGDPCGTVINLSECDFCVYHIQQEFGRMSKRSELQSATAGRGLDALRNKVLGKNEVFYAGQSFTAVPARKNVKQEAKDQKRLTTLKEHFQISPSWSSSNHVTQSKIKKEIPFAKCSRTQSKVANSVEFDVKQRLKDLERLKVLKTRDEDECTTQQPISSTTTKLSLEKLNFLSQKVPTLSKESFSIELNVNDKKAELAKLKALEIIKKKPIKKMDPNLVKYRGTAEGKKRVIDELNNVYENDVKRRKLKENEEENLRKTRIQKMIEATSSHVDLIHTKKNEQVDQYFKKMENKEKLEEKMLNTYKVPCKAVICKKCKYTAFSAADRCKEERHPLKVIDAEKRFFACEDCGNRTVTVYKIPKLSCKNCQSSRWKRAPMIREKKNNDLSANLSIRGDEEKFLGTLKSSANLNLLIPEEN